MPPLLQAESVSMRFGGVKALSDVSFDLYQGEILGLIGPNGAGKTTMFNCITGVQPDYRGHIRYDGRDLRHLKPHERAGLKIARTFQNLELFDELSALDNLLVPLDAFSRRGLIGDLLRLPTTLVDERKAQEEARSILHFLNLGDYADTPAGDLPVGLQRRVEIGRALCLEPRLLLLDEPAAGLDARETAELARLLATVRARFKVTVLIVDHDMALMMRICNRIYVLDYGKIIAEGPPEQVRDDPQVARAYLGEAAVATDVGSTEPARSGVAGFAGGGAGR
jgi:branched-chain amino acid transport system ATP-binding protein